MASRERTRALCRASVVTATLASAALGCRADPDEAGSNLPVPPAEFAACHSHLECATVAVPASWADPAGATLGLRIARAPALDPAQRRGVVVVNPGGPGAPMIARFDAQYLLYRAAFADALAHFDVVVFDWRGTGESEAIDCLDDQLVEELRVADLGLGDAASLPAIEVLRGRVLAACALEAPRLAEMGTESAARDLDVVRRALGEERISFLGFSYGSWLGATYATRYPERAAGLVLDSPSPFGADLGADLLSVSRAREAGLERFFELASADAASPFGGPTPASVAARFDALASSARRAPIAAGARRLGATDLGAAVSDLLGDADWTALAEELAAAEAGDGSSLLARADVAFGRGATGEYDGSLIQRLAVGCDDQPFSGAVDGVPALAALAAEARGVAPHGAFAGIAPWPLCAAWPAAPAQRPQIDATGALPALVLSGEHDAITGSDGAPALIAELRNGSRRLRWEGEGHGVATHSACARSAATTYLLDPTTVSDGVCPPD